MGQSDGGYGDEARQVAPRRAHSTGQLTGLAGSSLKLGPAYLGEPEVFHIFRDVRFSKNEAPYPTHIGGYIRLVWHVKTATDIPMACYVHVGAGETLTVGVPAIPKALLTSPKLVKWLAGARKTSAPLVK